MALSKKKIAGFEVRVGDINYGGHMGNDKALLLFQDARIKFLASIGFSEMNIGDETGIIMNEAHVFYKKEIFLYDRLSVTISVATVTASSFFLHYSVVRKSDNAEVLKGSTKLIAFNYAKKRIIRLPAAFLSKIELK